MSDLKLAPASFPVINPDDYVGPTWDFQGSTTTPAGTPGNETWYGSNGSTLTAMGDWAEYAINSSAWLQFGSSTEFGTLFTGSEWPIIRLRIRAQVRPTPGVNWRGWFFWATAATVIGSPGDPQWPFQVPNNQARIFWDEPDWVPGEWSEVVFDLRDYPELWWIGHKITHLRFDFSSQTGDVFEIDWVRVEQPVPSLPPGANALETNFDIRPDPAEPWRFERTDNLETAVRLSLYSDARAREGDTLPDGDGSFGEDLRGWWGSAYLSDSGEFGSRLWTLKRSVLTQETRQRARDFVLEALEWMIELGIAKSVEAETVVASRGVLEITVTITREGDTPARFAFLWESF